MTIEEEILERAEKYIDRITGPVHPELGRCWIWTGRGSKGWKGVYPSLKKKLNGKFFTFTINRLMYRMHIGPIPEGFHVHHRCENTKCVNPKHLHAISPRKHRELHGKSK